MRGALAGLALLALPAGPVQAAPTLSMPERAQAVKQDVTPFGSIDVPVGPWTSGAMQTETVEGEVTMTAWQVPGQTSTLALIAPLRDQLRAEGFNVLYECATDSCGGFDFRYALDLLPEPEMHVDLGDFRYLAAQKGNDFVVLLASSSAERGFVQLTRIGTAQPLPMAIAPPASAIAGPTAAGPLPSPATTAAIPTDLATLLDADGAVALDDLVFASGSSQLGTGTFASLRDLADYLGAHPDRRITLVGHTDASGAPAANIALSRQRAQSVLAHLVADYGVNPLQLDADGVGYLSPRASNLTEAGREKNRRVEAMLASTR